MRAIYIHQIFTLLILPIFTLLTIHTCYCCCKKCHFSLPLSFLKFDLFWKEFFVSNAPSCDIKKCLRHLNSPAPQS